MNGKTLEKMQCRALRFVFNDYDSTYVSLLNRARFPAVILSRHHNLCTEVFKHVHAIWSCSLKEEEEEEEEINLLAWLPCRPRKHIYKDGHNVMTCNSKNATVLS